MAGLAEAASACWVVGVEALFDEVASAGGVVVGDGGWGAAAEFADRVACQDLLAEGAVAGPGVSPLGGGAPVAVGLGPVGGAASALGEGGAAGDGTDAHRSSPRWWMLREPLVFEAFHLNRAPGYQGVEVVGDVGGVVGVHAGAGEVGALSREGVPGAGLLTPRCCRVHDRSRSSLATPCEVRAPAVSARTRAGMRKAPVPEGT